MQPMIRAPVNGGGLGSPVGAQAASSASTSAPLPNRRRRFMPPGRPPCPASSRGADLWGPGRRRARRARAARVDPRQARDVSLAALRARRAARPATWWRGQPSGTTTHALADHAESVAELGDLASNGFDLALRQVRPAAIEALVARQLLRPVTGEVLEKV